MSYKHDLHNDRFYDMVFQKKEGGYFVELGGLQGELHSQTHFLEKERNWKGIVVEPNPIWSDELKENRNCTIITNPISDKKEKVTFLRHIDNPAFSKIDNGIPLPQGDVEEIPMESLKLSDVLKDNNSPKTIDVLCLDIEGMELKVLDEVLKNSKRKINLIALEFTPVHEVVHFFYDKPYVKIRNPFLDFVRIDREKQMILRYENGDFKYFNGELYEGSVVDLESVNWEFYYIHVDMLKIYPKLKRLIEKVDFFNLNV